MSTAADPVVKIDNVAPEILATAIVDVAKAAKALLGSRLSKRALLVLLHDKTKIPYVTIERVLDAAADLGSFVKR